MYLAQAELHLQGTLGLIAHCMQTCQAETQYILCFHQRCTHNAVKTLLRPCMTSGLLNAYAARAHCTTTASHGWLAYCGVCSLQVPMTDRSAGSAAVPLQECTSHDTSRHISPALVHNTLGPSSIVSYKQYLPQIGTLLAQTSTRHTV